MPSRRVYIAGAGVISRHHADAVDHLPDRETTIKAADPDPDAVAAFENENPDAETYGDVSEMLDEPAQESDIVVVATPTFAHHKLARKGLESGRHVLCEKPLAMNVSEASDLLNTAREHDRVIGSCACRFLGSDSLTRVAELLEDGGVGEPYRVTFVDRQSRSRTGIEYQPESRWFLDVSKSGGGVLMDWGPYDIAVLSELLEPTAVEVEHAWTANPSTGVDLEADTVFDVEQHVGASLRYHREDGATLPVNYERAACTHGKEDGRFEIEGTEGAIEWTWKAMVEGDETFVRHRYDVDGDVIVETEEFVHEDPVGAMDRPLVYFDCVVNGESAPVPTNEAAADNFACLRSIYKCEETGEKQRVEFGSTGNGR